MSPELVKYLSVIGEATWQTLIMVLFSTVFSMILGIPLGILLCTSDPAAGLRPHKILYQVLSSDRVDIEDAGMLADIIKDLSEAEDHYWASEYRRLIVDEMKKKAEPVEEKRVYSYATGKIEEHHEKVPEDDISDLRQKYVTALPDDRERMKHQLLEMMGML